MLILALVSLASAQLRERLPLPQIQTPKAAGERLLNLPVAPAPVNLSIEPQNPGLHRLRWQGPGGSQFRVYRRPPNVPTWTQLADGVAGMEYLDRAIVAPGTVYRVETVQPNTLPAGADIVYTNPPRPEMPVAFRGTTDIYDPVKINLYWKTVANTTKYRLFGPGQPPTGTLIDWSSYGTAGGAEVRWSVAGLPPGTHTFSMTSVYGDAYITDGMPTATVVTTAYQARYRITVNGFRCLWATSDDPPLQGDGKGDEIYVAVFVGSELGPQRSLDRKLFRSRVYGDVNFHPERIKAGSASPSGGVWTGTAVPANAGIPALPVAPMTDQFPMLIWDGVLTNGDIGLAIIPTVWEADGNDKNYQAWSGWLLGTRYDWMNVLDSTFRPELWRTYAVGPQISKDWIGITVDDSNGYDVPIGYTPSYMTSLTTRTRIYYSSGAFLVNRSNLEQLLGKGSTAMMHLNLSNSGGVGGNYDLFLQVERLP